jgi:membrane-associated phospholipid phosphatase
LTPVWQRVPEAVTRRALRRLFSAYLVLSGSAFLFPHRPESWPLLLTLHLGGALLLAQPRPPRDLCRTVARRRPQLSAVVADWYALALVPFLYAELAVLNTAVYGGRYFDGWVQGWELRLFGGQPSHELAAKLPYPLLSEVLHFCYLSYYLIIYGPPLVLYFRRRIADHQRVVFALMLTFFAHYLFFVFLPVQGPRYVFPAPGGELAQGFIYRLVHTVLEAGSSRGAAFPSSHVGVAVTQAAMAFLVWRRAAPILVLASIGLALGAVYGGFHYATDCLCGLLLGLALFALSPRLAERLGRGEGCRGTPEDGCP